MMTSYKISEIPYCRVLGRTDGSTDPLSLFWTASGLEFNVRAREVFVTVDVDYQLFEPWIAVIIDGVVSQRMMLTKGTHEICLLRAMKASVTRNIRILRDTQAMPDDRKMRLQILSVRTAGHFEPLSETRMRLEFIGDSITSGEGCAGAAGEQDWIPGIFDCTKSYPFLTSGILNAEYHVISSSGWGIYCGFDGRRDHSIPPCYRQVCGVLKSDSAKKLGAGKAWNFSSWQPDAVIINLGTNDAGSFSSSGEFNPFTGFTNPMRRNPDGSMNEEDRLSIENAAVDFLHTVRECNPKSYILWCCGMLGDSLALTLENAVARFQHETGDSRVTYIPLPMTADDEFGSRSHPGLPAHRKTAALLAAKIAELA